MNKTVKTIVTLMAASLLFAGCDLKKDEKENKPKVTTIEEIQKQKGKPARVVKATKASLPTCASSAAPSKACSRLTPFPR